MDKYGFDDLAPVVILAVVGVGLIILGRALDKYPQDQLS